MSDIIIDFLVIIKSVLFEPISHSDAESKRVRLVQITAIDVFYCTEQIRQFSGRSIGDTILPTSNLSFDQIVIVNFILITSQKSSSANWSSSV